MTFVSISFKSVTTVLLRVHAKPLSSRVIFLIFLTFAFSLGASSKDSDSGQNMVLGK